MQRLYNEHEMLTADGQAIDHATAEFCRAIMAECVACGQSLRDAELVMLNAITGTASEAMLRRNMDERKRARADKPGTYTIRNSIGVEVARVTADCKEIALSTYAISVSVSSDRLVGWRAERVAETKLEKK